MTLTQQARLSEKILKLCEKGRLSIGKAAEILDKNIYDLQEMAKEKGIILSATEESMKKSGETTERLIKTLKKAK